MHINTAQLELHTWEEDQAVNSEAFPVLLGHFPTHDQTLPTDQQMSCKKEVYIIT